MDIEAFERALDACVDADGARPGCGVVQEQVVADVRGMSTPAALLVLSTAVSYMDEAEVYLEVGSYRGRSLAGALTQSRALGVAIENFSEFPEPAPEAAAELDATLARWNIADRVTVLDGDAFALLGGLRLPAPVGVYFYDGVHSGWAQYAALGLAEHLLADSAIVIVDDASWPQVASATDAYVERHPGYTLLRDFRASSQEDEVWCNGLRVYAWLRPPTASSVPSADVTRRALLQRYVDSPLRSLAWRSLSRYPRAFQTVRRIATRGGTEVQGQSP